MIPRGTDNNFKQENSTTNGETSSKVLASSTSSWTRLKDPRIVRVSRALGGKDRHSKVCTVRGLRDRRVRLSVPTAIQLYDLQDRLGLAQPSKVVDWLLNVAKNEIDELPPLQMPPGVSFTNLMTTPNLDSVNMVSSSTTSNSHDHHNPIMKSKGEITSSDGIHHHEISNSWARNGTSHGHDDHDHQNTSHPLISSLLMSGGNSTPFVRWDPSNLTLHHPPISLGLMAAHDQRSDQRRHDDQDHHNLQSFSPQIPYSSSHHHQQQVLVYQPYNFPLEFDTKQMSFQGFGLLGNSTQLSDERSSFPFSMSNTATANLLPSQNSSTNDIEDHDRRNELHS